MGSLLWLPEIWGFALRFLSSFSCMAGSFYQKLYLILVPKLFAVTFQTEALYFPLILMLGHIWNVQFIICGHKSYSFLALSCFNIFSWFELWWKWIQPWCSVPIPFQIHRRHFSCLNEWKALLNRKREGGKSSVYKLWSLFSEFFSH